MSEPGADRGQESAATALVSADVVGVGSSVAGSASVGDVHPAISTRVAVASPARTASASVMPVSDQ